MADVKWIKIVTDIFDNRKIKQIEKMPEGDAILVIWLKLLCLAGNINDSGMIYLTKDIPYNDETLAVELDRPINIIKLSLKTFTAFGMIEIVDDFLHISSWEKYQNIAGMAKIREQTRLRVAKHREMKQIEDSNVTVTLRNATDKIRIDKNRVDKSSNIVEQAQPYIASIKEIIFFLNQKTDSSYQYKTKATQDKIKARLNEGFTVDNFKTVISKKVSDWKNDEKMCRYLRPETLFGTKFESYLNEKKADKPKTKKTYSEKQLKDVLVDMETWEL